MRGIFFCRGGGREAAGTVEVGTNAPAMLPLVGGVGTCGCLGIAVTGLINPPAGKGIIG